jgi:hypothetical protein
MASPARQLSQRSVFLAGRYPKGHGGVRKDCGTSSNKCYAYALVLGPRRSLSSQRHVIMARKALPTTCCASGDHLQRPVPRHSLPNELLALTSCFRLDQQSYAVTTCGARWKLGMEIPPSWIPSMANLSSPTKIPSKPSRDALRVALLARLLYRGAACDARPLRGLDSATSQP